MDKKILNDYIDACALVKEDGHPDERKGKQSKLPLSGAAF